MADVSVRPARADDVPEIARIQLETWRTAYARWLPEPVLTAVSAEQAGQLWRAAVTAPPTPRHRVLVAQEKDWRVGFAAFGPAAEEDRPDGADPAGTGQVQTILVEPRWGRRGHGSRLLAAVVDLMRADGVRTALAWLPDQDTASLAFYGSAGWERDGYARTLETDGLAITEVRLHVSLEEP
ncbi:MAG TPA: GNAT family N-acetyltransferase [Mycobacteriales bacterium]|nr:GNAT family N-acetyltransferase [Mycobacteriales bacterium]